ncbi:hypothetical protein [Prosthecobacter sp.]|uniref:hypothetical protein n=1 Tax=Prosthecobacter sp. TaxID=1965333 RepID=UPI003784CE85
MLAGVDVSYQLPTTSPLPQTYRVTLAIVDEKKPDWIISQFAAGVVRTVTVENGGKFSETWDGLDDNFMPVPPGTYGLKGIYMPASQWPVDGAYHSITPRYITSAEAWRALPGEAKAPIVVGDPVNSPIGDVDVGADGMAVFCYQYLENARNFYTADFKKPINYDQATPGYNSGGAAGGKAVATDGVTSWCSENEGFVFRTDGKKFGKADGRFRKGVHVQEGHVTAMAAWRGTNQSFVYLAERGRLVRDEKRWYHPEESTKEMMNRILVLDGDTAAQLASVPVNGPLGVVARWGDRLWVLHKDGDGFAVSAVKLKAGLPEGALERVLQVPAGVTPDDLEVDSHGRIYLADARANKVLQFSSGGKPLLVFGKLEKQRSGSYDAQSFMSPEKLSCWRDAEGHDRLVVIERQGLNRVSEWNAEDGSLMREWLSVQTYANAGYAVDPRHPDQFYIQGHGGWLMRLHVDYQTGEWRPEAVYPDVCSGRFENRHFGFPRLFYRGDTRYLAWSRGNFIYREAGDRWLASAAILTEGEGKERKRYVWHDENGDGQVQDSEYQPHLTTPPMNPRYWGDSWLEDFSLIAIQEGSADVWRLAPESFDKHGNPVYAADGWKKLLTDPVLDARKQGTTTATFGGNEIGDRFSSAWAMVAGSMADGFYVNARGPDLGANFGAQQKLSRYVPDGKGGYELKWRVGRVALHGTAEEGEVYGSIHVMAPIGGLITQVDQSRMGMVLYTEDGLYVETLFPDERKTGGKTKGPYNLPGEFFTGYAFANADNGKVCLALGKTTPVLFEAEGWTTKGNPVRRLESVQKSVSIAAAQIASAPEFALAVRKQRNGGTTARVAQFAPLPGGGPALDGSMSGWEVCEPVAFAADAKQTVEVRCGFDPKHLYLRWHVRLGRKFDAKPLEPAERLFTHDREADTLSFYIQGDTQAKPAKGGNGRAGDARFVFGLFKDNGQVRPVALAMLPKWGGAGKPSPLTYQTPAGGAAAFEHVGLLSSATLGHAMDADGEGFVIAAAIPRASVPMLPEFDKELRTQVNFDATFGGHNRIWWANADGSATRETYDEPTEARLYPGSWSQASFAPMSRLPVRAWSVIGPFGFAKLPQLKHLEDRPEITRTLAATAFPPEQVIDLGASISGEQTQTRKAARTLKWKPASISGDIVAFDPAIGWKGYEDEGSAYLITWVQSPRAVNIHLKALDEHHGHHAVRVWVNGQPLPSIHPKGQSAKDLHHSLDATQPVALQAGWNKVLLRYDQIWGSNQIGLAVDAAPEVLWSLKFSATPPETRK